MHCPNTALLALLSRLSQKSFAWVGKIRPHTNKLPDCFLQEIPTKQFISASSVPTRANSSLFKPQSPNQDSLSYSPLCVPNLDSQVTDFAQSSVSSQLEGWLSSQESKLCMLLLVASHECFPLLHPMNALSGCILWKFLLASSPDCFFFLRCCDCSASIFPHWSKPEHMVLSNKLSVDILASLKEALVSCFLKGPRFAASAVSDRGHSCHVAC